MANHEPQRQPGFMSARIPASTAARILAEDLQTVSNNMADIAALADHFQFVDPFNGADAPEAIAAAFALIARETFRLRDEIDRIGDGQIA